VSALLLPGLPRLNIFVRFPLARPPLLSGFDRILPLELCGGCAPNFKLEARDVWQLTSTRFPHITGDPICRKIMMTFFVSAILQIQHRGGRLSKKAFNNTEYGVRYFH